MSWILRPQSSSAISAACAPSTSTDGPVPAFWNLVMAIPTMKTSLMAIPFWLAPGLEVVGEVLVALAVLAGRNAIHDLDGHAHGNLGRVRGHVDQVALDRAAALEVDDRRDVRNFDAWERAVHDRVDVERAAVRELPRLDGAARAALRAGVALAEED